MMSVGERIARFARQAAILPCVRSASESPTVRRGVRRVVPGIAVSAAAIGLGLGALLAVLPASGRTATAATPYPTPALKWDVSMSDQTPIPAIKCPHASGEPEWATSIQENLPT